jgi:hypothetical protein
MKKIFWIFLMMFCVSVSIYAEDTSFGEVLTQSTEQVYSDARAVIDTVYHDGKQAIQTVYGDMKAGTSSLYPDVKQAVISIANGIGVAAEHVYMVLVKKYVVLGVKELGIFIGAIILLLLGYFGWNKKTKGDVPITYKLIPQALFIFVGLVMLANVNYDDMLTGLINPEYGAINYILDFSKGLVK